VRREGRDADPLVAEAVRIKIAIAIGGGYNRRARALSPQLRAEIMERDGGRCLVCGSEATQIDHINADPDLVARDINDPENLQAICDPCHRLKTMSMFKPIRPEQRAKADEIRARINAPRPLRECDDEQNWKTAYRTHGSTRSALLKSQA
jgi:hypothetical protein